MNLFGVFHSQSPLHKELTSTHIISDYLQSPALQEAMKLFRNKKRVKEEQHIIKSVVKYLEGKASSSCKLKIISYLLEISKQTQFDIAQIIYQRKIKCLNKISKLKFTQIPTDKKTLDLFITTQLIIPIYNYLLKIAMNQQLYKTCIAKQIPFDDIFRRGSKIRFVWIFKIYNLVNMLSPIIQTLIKIIKLHTQWKFCIELACKLYEDMKIMNDFIVKAIVEAAHDNFVIMPYFDMLQFYESLTEQFKLSQKITQIYETLLMFISLDNKNRRTLAPPLIMNIQTEILEQIELQAMRVKLISNALKCPKKDHTRLQTQYIQKLQEKSRKCHETQISQYAGKQQFFEKYQNLD